MSSWPNLTWTKVSGPGPDTVQWSNGAFKQLELEPDSEIVLETELVIPETLDGVPTKGDRLYATVNSLYPIDLEYDGEALLSESFPTVASGPALITVVPEISPEHTAKLRMRLRAPNNQLYPTWVNVGFSTEATRLRFQHFDMQWARLALADALAGPGHRELVANAARVVEEVSDGTTFDLDTALTRVADMLAGVSDQAKRYRVHVVNHSHIDMNWLWTWPDTAEVIKRDFRSVVAMMNDYPDMTFTHSQPATYQVIESEEPELFESVKKLIADGRWEAATMTWVEGDTNMASGEAMARQLLQGVHYTRRVLGTEPSTFMAPDTFGHAGNLPQLAVSAGARRYYHHRCNPAGSDYWPAYWWEGQDGTRILALTTSSYNGDISAGAIARATAKAHSAGLDAGLLFHGIGDHGGGPARHGLDYLKRLQGEDFMPEMFCSTLAAYGDDILASGAHLPTHRGESSTIFEGCYTTHADTKRYNRYGENALSTADTLASVAGVEPGPGMTDAWRKVLFNQFHDILDGSAIPEPYEDHRKDFKSVMQTAERLIDRSVHVLQAGVPQGRIVVTNPTALDRRDLVLVRGLQVDEAVWLKDASGERTPGQRTTDGRLCFVASVPALGTSVYELDMSGPKPIDVDAREAHWGGGPVAISLMPGLTGTDAPYIRVETTTYIAHVRRSCGVIVSLYDKQRELELVAFGTRRGSDYADDARADLALNVLQLLEEHPHPMSAWHLDEVYRETSLLKGAETQIVETGPVRVVLSVKAKLSDSSIEQRIVFYRDLARIDFDTELDWADVGGPERGVPNLKASFTMKQAATEAWFETPFGAVARAANGQEVPALRWAAVQGPEGGIAIINDSKYGYDALGSRLRLTLVRSGYDPDPDSDSGRHRFSYSLLPFKSSWRSAGLAEAAAALNQPLIARRSTGAEEAKGALRPSLQGGTGLISCLKRSEDGLGTIVRIYESRGSASTPRLYGIPEGARVWATNIVEDRFNEVTVEAGSAKVDLRPWQVVTLLIEG